MKIMKKTLSLALVLMISLSTVIGIIPMAASDAVDKGDFDTSFPTYCFNFIDKHGNPIVTKEGFASEKGDGYNRLIVQKSDPYTVLDTPDVTMDQMIYASVGYRVKVKASERYAEIYYSSADDGAFNDENKIEWAWGDTTGAWDDQIIHMSAFENNEGVGFTAFRFDAIEGHWDNTVIGDHIDLKYLAFFTSEEDANAFNYEEYARYIKAVREFGKVEKPRPDVILPGDFTVPEPSAIKHYNADDNVQGSFKMTHNEDGTLTVSYNVNGQPVSYTVPDTAENARGPLGGTDDLGRTLWDQFTVVDPDYTKLVRGKNAEGKTAYVPETVDAEPFTVGVSETRKRDVGMFYWLWHGVHGDQGINDISKILEKYGDEAKNGTEPAWVGGYNTIYHFAEPLYGYYYGGDKWVIRKHMELLANAGVDFLFFDTTNNSVYTEYAIEVMAILHDLNMQGIDAPEVCFYTNFEAEERVRLIYDNIYAKNLYPDTWYCLDGKPLIIAPRKYNIDDFFTVRDPQWPNEPKKANGFPWMDWTWPQRANKNMNKEEDIVNVSVAQHAGNSVFSSVLYGYMGNWGRSFDGSNDNLTDDSYKLGLNMQKQFNYAMTLDTDIVTVTGWNEWTAGKQDPNPANGWQVVFIDTFNYEYSRDIEMSRGGYFDNYYMQLISNIRGISGSEPTLVQDGRNYIDVTGSFDQWEKIPVTYGDPMGDTTDRDYIGFGHTPMIDRSGRNDINALKVTGDTTYLYLYMRTADTVERSTDEGSAWMQIYLNVDSNETGWYGYDFIVNTDPESDTVTNLAKYNGDGTTHSFENKYKIDYRVFGNEIMFAVPLEYLGVTSYDRINIQFKGVDSKTQIKEMEDFYTYGDTAPLGRPNFIYQTYLPGVTEGEGMAVVPLARKLRMDGSKPWETIADEEETSETPDEHKGCKAFQSVGILPMIAVALPVVIKKKRK